TGAAFDPTNAANLPVREADTEVDTLNLSAQAGTRFGDDLSLTFRYRYYDYDNQSPRIEFPGYVRFHSVWEAIPRITVPSAYTKQDLGAELSWDIFQASRLGVAYRHEIWDREFREVESADEDIFILSFDTRPIDRVNVRASYEFGDRSIDGYNAAAQGFSFLEPGEGVDNQPTLRKFAQAARRYNQISVTADFFPAPEWSFTVGASGRDEDYDESELGLLADEILQYNAELAYTPGEHLNLYLFGHRSDRDVFQRARTSGGTPSVRPLDNWELSLDEVTDTWGAGVTAHPRKRWTVDVSGNWSRSDDFADFFAFAGGLPLAGTPVRTEATDFDNYEDIELLSLLSRLGFRLNERTEIGLSYRYEDYTIDSFILQGLRNYLPGALLLNADNGDYQASIVGLELRLAF
ncbi:MAG TPA: MtrB/PioB family outer membrane beta-barrel protein, partial [Thermoanaerobaculia bacterium]|nr:MtrB/PioB family outer membrane beta-barrel protein [Thermoanaerobaculia bacterium]